MWKAPAVGGNLMFSYCLQSSFLLCFENYHGVFNKTNTFRYIHQIHVKLAIQGPTGPETLALLG